jgi:peptidoglycan/xylan/chitin deacetylase (PgdA/CDA1 family)
MIRRKVILFSCLLIIMASLFACTYAKKNENAEQVVQKKESSNIRQVAQKKNTAHNGQAALKNWNEGDYRLPSEQHRQQVQSLSKQFPSVVIYKGNPRIKRVALTFDDGPDNYYTPRILDILHAKGVPGTFFMVGIEVKRFPDMVKRIVAEGNAIGNHSWDHPKLWTLSNERVTQEVVSTANEIQRITGRRTTLFRPPYGRVSPADIALIHNLGYRIIDWSVDTLDWKGTPAPTILQYVNKEVSPGGIILEHCFAGRPGELNGTLKALPQIIDHLRAQGYEFVTVPTLLGL